MEPGEGPTSVFRNEHHRCIAEAAQILGKEYGSLLQSLVPKIRSVPGFATVSPERALKAIASWLTQLQEKVEALRRERGAAGSDTEQPPVIPGASREPSAPSRGNLRWTGGTAGAVKATDPHRSTGGGTS
jgi:hypothetical protein